MRKTMTAIFMALAPVSGLAVIPMAVAPAQAQQGQVTVSLFYEQLAPHGRWVELPRWGWVWFPTTVDADWRPYTRGRWVWTEEYGWTWVSNEPFGWAVYHYGRWGYDDQYGWVWVPGQKWGPAWVAFRYSNDNVGWAPLPPDTGHVSAEVRIDDAVLTADYYRPRWVFVPTRQFVAVDIRTHVVPVERNVTFIRQTQNVTNIRIQNNIVINRSIDPVRLRTVVRRDIPRVRVREVDNVRNINIRERNQTTINQIQVFKREVNITREARPPERARAKEQDRPKVRVQREAVNPTERRDRARPGAPLSDRDRSTQPDRERGAERDRQRLQPGQPPRTTPGAPPTREQDRDRRTQPDRERGTQPDRERKPGETGTQENRRQERPGQTPPRTQDDRRGATPAQPPSRTQPDQRRATPAQPAQPPKAAPGAPPSRQGAQPGGQQQRQQPQKKSGQTDDDKKKAPNR